MTRADQGNQASKKRALFVLAARRSLDIRGDGSFLDRIRPPHTIFHHAKVEQTILSTAKVFRTRRCLTQSDELPDFW
jgi:hypothetical protein